jgi:hypothetical protein
MLLLERPTKMKFLSIGFILIQTLLYGQDLDSSWTYLYNQTLYKCFSDQTINKETKKSDNIIVIISSEKVDTNLLIKNINTHKIDYYSNHKEIETIFKKPYNKNKGKFVYYINHGPYGDQGSMFQIWVTKYVVSKYTKKESIDLQRCDENEVKLMRGIVTFDAETNSWKVKMKAK